MPLYIYRCETCLCQVQQLRGIAQRDEPNPCPACSKPMSRRITAPVVHTDYPGYSCPISGKWIEGKRAHQENLAEHGCRVLEVGETKQLQERKAAEEAKFDRELDTTVGKLVAAMPAQKRERLAAEMQSGLDMQVSRS
jgi:putative FmdB family regulatory protein